MSKETGGPAFPLYCGPGDEANASGMTLRDWLAGQALVGFCANLGVQVTCPRQAQIAYAIADAMLKERDK